MIASGWAWSQTHVGPYARLTLLVLADGADDGGAGVLAMRWAADHTSLSADELMAAADELEDAGLLFVCEPLGPLIHTRYFDPDDPTFVMALHEPERALDYHTAWIDVERSQYCTPEFYQSLHPQRRATSRRKPDLKRRALIAFDQRCAYCTRQGTSMLDPDQWPWELDRIIPGADGGEYEASNVVLACRVCNRDKRARLDWAGPTLSLSHLESITGVA
jgi:hypothetical protein